MSENANFDQVDDYIASQLGSTVRSGGVTSTDPRDSPAAESTTSNLGFEFNEFKSVPFNSTASNAQELQSVQLKLKDSQVLLDQYKVKIEQQQQEQSQYQLSSKLQLNGEKARSGLDPEIHYLQQHILTLNSRIETLENANKEVVYNNDMLTEEVQALRKNVSGYHKDMLNHTKNTENLLVVCDTYKKQLEDVSTENTHHMNLFEDKKLQLIEQEGKYTDQEKERDRYKEQSQNSQNDSEKLQFLEREFMTQSENHQIQLTQLKNEALLHSQMHQEQRIEYDTMILLHKQKQQQVQTELEATKNGLAYDVHTLKTTSQREQESVKSHYQTSLQVIQQQLHVYKDVSANILKQQQLDFEKQIEELQRNHGNESAQLLQWAQQQIHMVTLEKDSKIAGQLDNSGNESISRLHQSELLKLHESHQQNIEEMRGKIGEAFRKELDTLKRKLGKTQLELTMSVVENQELHTKVTSYWSQILQSQQKTQKVQQQLTSQIDALKKNIASTNKDLADAVSAREKAIHESMRLRLLVDGRQKGSVAASAIRLQSNLGNMYDEVNILRKEQDGKNTQQQHVLDSSSQSQQLYSDTKRRLDVVVKQFQRVLALLHTKRKGDAIEEKEQEECLRIDEDETDIDGKIELPGISIQPVDVYNTSISKQEADINEDITRGIEFLTIKPKANVHNDNMSNNTSNHNNESIKNVNSNFINTPSNISNSSILASSATQTQSIKPVQPYKPVHAPQKRPQVRVRQPNITSSTTNYGNPAAFVVTNASQNVQPVPSTTNAQDNNNKAWFDEE